MLVFRQGRRARSGNALLQALLSRLRELVAARTTPPAHVLLEALLRCGELECGLADLNWPQASTVAAATDALAELFLSRSPSVRFPELIERLGRLTPPQQITVSTPEGFAYYALHPLRYADLAGALPLASPHAALVGIRSIGTTLSAVLAAALRRRGLAAERITVRPAGHPF